MADDEKVPTLDSAIGARLRSLRHERGISQDDVARAAQACGLEWTRAVVAALEGGRRELSAGELVLLPLALQVARPDQPAPRLADLIYSVEPQKVSIGPDAVVDVGWLRDQFLGAKPSLQNFEADMPRTRESIRRAPADAERLRTYRRWWPKATLMELAEAERAAMGEAEQKAARSLDVEPVELSVRSFRRWGRSLTGERDARASALESKDARSLQAARGHITRQLLEELRSQPGG